MNANEILFVTWSFFFQCVLIAHFALRKWLFEAYTGRYGWLVYALGIPAAGVSLLLLLSGMGWFFWLGGLLQLIWSIYGCWVEYVHKIQWRNPIRWRLFIPYVFLYLATIMFQWWPLAQINRSYWVAYAFLFLVSTGLNLASHRRANRPA